MVHNELSELVDDGNCVFITLVLGVAPGEKAVAPQNHAVTFGTFLYRATQHHRQLETGTLPGNPDQMVIKEAVELFHLFVAVRGSSKSDAPVRMQMIDV